MNASTLTPAELFEAFREAPQDIQTGIHALNRFRAVQDKLSFLEPTIQFVKTESRDRVRSWGTNILEMIGGEKAYRTLFSLLDKNDALETKRKYLYTRFFALRGIATLATELDQQSKLPELLERLWNDSDEDYLTRAEAALLLARQGQPETKEWIEQMLSNYTEFWPIIRTLRALREFPLPNLAEAIVRIIHNSQYLDHKYDAIRVLGLYRDDLKVVRALGDVLYDSNSYLRLTAVQTLALLKDPASLPDLLRTLQDSDAEVRAQTARAILTFSTSEQAAAVIVNQALTQNVRPPVLTYLIDALRLVDPGRTAATEILSKELMSEDRKRAEAAEKILVELGGWAAVQRLSQRRRTLEYLDGLLADSEKVVRATFENTIRQARLNFYFAMGVNALIVVVGITLVILAIVQLINRPDQLASWIVPGASGVIGVLINLTFNNPRRNARDDLAALINVNVIFLGFLRQVNEIDATFKHAYMEDPDFGPSEMRQTADQIEAAVRQTLNMAAQHLRENKLLSNPDQEKTS